MASWKSTNFNLEITIISAKNLKNVNWRNGDLMPYATFYLDPNHQLSTRPDDSGSTRPVWNECFTLSHTRSIHASFLTLNIFHSRPSETPKSLVGTVQFPLSKLLSNSNESTCPTYNLELRRPSGRPQGKVRVKFALKQYPTPPPMQQQDYHITYQNSHYSPPPPPPPPQPTPFPPPPPPLPPHSARDYREHSHSPYNQYYSGHYSPPPPPSSHPFFNNRTSNSVVPGGPSAPIDLSSSNDQKPLPLPPPPTPPPSRVSPPRPSRVSNYNAPSVPSAPNNLGHIRGLSLEEGGNYQSNY